MIRNIETAYLVNTNDATDCHPFFQIFLMKRNQSRLFDGIRQLLESSGRFLDLPGSMSDTLVEIDDSVEIIGKSDF
jgi:hypothetical protein